MIWLSWRQLRTNVWTAGGVLLAAATMWILTRPQRDALSGHIVDDHRFIQLLNNGIALLPVVVGAFWGAPLVARELESGTYRLVWTQSVTRSRWLATKVAFVGLVGLVVAALATVGVDWWSSTLDAANGNRFAGGLFGMRGIVPVAYTVFAFGLGTFAGTALRKVVPAVATTMVVFLATRIAVTQWLRPHYRTPVTGPFSGGPTGSVSNSGDWILTQGARTVSGGDVPVTYQPGSRFWEFQWIESGLFVGAGALLLAGTFWWLARKAG